MCNLPQAEPEFRRAIELNPNYATAHQWYGECLQGEGRFAEAVDRASTRPGSRSLSLIINASYGCVLGESGQPAEGVAQLHKTLEMDSTFWVAHEILGGILEGKGDLTGAAAEYKKSIQQNWTANGAARLASVKARLGKKAEVRKTLDNLTTQSRQHWVPPYALAVIHLALGEKEEACGCSRRVSTSAVFSRATTAAQKWIRDSIPCAAIPVSRIWKGAL